MESSHPKRRFPPPWQVERTEHCYVVRDGNGLALATVYCRDDLQSWSFGHQHLTSDEARRIAHGIARLPELLNRSPIFPPSDNPRWSRKHPYHVALAEVYVNEHYSEMVARCALNGVPCERTGGVIEVNGSRWCVYKFARQFDAIQFWDAFEGKWMRGNYFISPERPRDLPALRRLRVSDGRAD